MSWRHHFPLATWALGACITPTSPPGDAPTWYGDVKPIVEQHCTRCHHPVSHAPVDFTDDATAVAFAAAMKTEIEAGRMPPPAADPSCRDYVSSDSMFLPDAARATVAAWADAGAPEGSPADYLAPSKPSVELVDPDVVLRIPTPYAPTFQDAANPGNEYRCFALEHGRDEPFFITAMQAVVDQPRIVHHVVLWTRPRSERWAHYDEATGVDCINEAGSGDGMLAGWAPGSMPLELPDGLGLRVDVDDDLIVQMHYYRPGAETDGLADRSGYAFRIADTVERRVFMLPAGSFDFTIPAGDPDFRYELDIAMPADLTATVWAAFPHMHRLGRSYRAWVEEAEGDTCVIEGEYSFDNQQTYQFIEPVEVGAGDRLHLRCVWDNSPDSPGQMFDPPRDVEYGERTDEEMCYAFTFASIGAP
jgi:hypothetical protein